ncbi:hypothetical protein BDZ89DRAFT_661206 [Hymenopellis radicata]|nr:hypothetical protein BDZ89DRAFT_661206 [Hymenopellis radicata]
MATTLCRLNDDGDVDNCVSQVGRKTRNARCVTAANFTDLPFDVLLEVRYICVFRVFFAQGHLDCCMSYNHALRNVFMIKASRGAWKQARANANNLPEPFAEISEPAWANLVYVGVKEEDEVAMALRRTRTTRGRGRVNATRKPHTCAARREL